MSFRQRVMSQITQHNSTASEALTNGMISIMGTFTSYKTEDFYGTNIKPAMACSHFFGVCGLVETYNQEINKSKSKGAGKKWRR